jgi:hypothetical protein
VVLFVVSGVLRRRTPAASGKGRTSRDTGGRTGIEGRSPAGSPARAGEDDLSEIEDILKRHGIS